jgi:diguanylate cyclase (GGDEF)-like protein
VARLALLEEASKRIAESLDEGEILRRTVEALVDRFGYAEAAVSLLVGANELELTAISGTEEIGFKPGHRQKMSEGIIGHVAGQRAAYITGDIEHDPYYFSMGKRSGSAAGVPILGEGRLLGVLYIESTVPEAFNQDDIQTLDTLSSHMLTAVQKARLYAQTQAHLHAITTLQSMSQAILSSLELQQVFETVIQLLQDTFGYSYVSIYLLEREVLHLAAQVGYPNELTIRDIPATQGITGRSARTKQVQFVQEVTSDPDFLRAALEVDSEICVPLLKEDKVFGVLNVEAAPGHPLTDNDAGILTALAGPITIAIENARLHAEVKGLALTDGLTGLLNRRGFDQALKYEIVRANRYHYPLALVMIDMDSFKEFNDRWGHPAGDKQLKEVADLLRGGLRASDFVARYGGDEFALILPHTAKAVAFALAGRLRAAAEQSNPNRSDGSGPAVGYTFSIGVAVFPEDGGSEAELLLAADQAELSAKKLGKNRVCLSNDSQTYPPAKT